MNRTFPRFASRRHIPYRPSVERLEPRLAPGDAFLIALWGWPMVASDVIEQSLQTDMVVLATEDFAPTIEIRVHTRPAANEPRQVAKDDSSDRPESSKPVKNASQIFVATPELTRRPNLHHATMPASTISTVNGPPKELNSPAREIAREVEMSSESSSVSMIGQGVPAMHAGKGMTKADALDMYGKLPLRFEANVGQADSRVDFMSRVGDSTVFLTPTAAVFALQNSEFRIQNSESPSFEFGTQNSKLKTQNSVPGVALYMQIVSGNSTAQAEGVNKLPGQLNYLMGNDATNWHSNIASYAQVHYQDVYPGIDLVYRGDNQQLEYDFVVTPGGDPKAITLNFAGAESVGLNPRGDLVLHTAIGDIVQQKPFTYQDVGQTRHEVPSHFVVEGTTVRFNVADYDPMLPLVIDPLVLGYSTYLGGNTDVDYGFDITVDRSGNAYMIGNTDSISFPTTPGAFDTTSNGNTDVFVTKLNAAGSALVYSTFLGGSMQDWGDGIAVGVNGNAYVTGHTSSANFPTTPGAYDQIKGNNEDAFLAKLTADGSSLVYSSFVGGSFFEYGENVAVDTFGHAYVTGATGSNDFPITPGAADTTKSAFTDAFVFKMARNGSALLYSTFVSGSDSSSGRGIDIDATGHVYVTGFTSSSDFPTTPGAFDTTSNGLGDSFVLKLNPTGTSLVYSTYLGGSADELGEGVAVDSSGNAYVSGRTLSANFPTTPGAFDTVKSGAEDLYVTKLSADGSTLVYSTFLGGSALELAGGIAVDSHGSAYVTGATQSTNFPVTSDAFDQVPSPNDAILTKLSPTGAALVYSTYLGGSGSDRGWEVAVDSANNAYVVGETLSTNFPTTPGAFKRRTRASGEAFVTKFAEV